MVLAYTECPLKPAACFLLWCGLGWGREVEFREISQRNRKVSRKHKGFEMQHSFCLTQRHWESLSQFRV